MSAYGETIEEPGIKAVGFVHAGRHVHACANLSTLISAPDVRVWQQRLRETARIKVPAMNVPGTKKSGTCAPVPALLLQGAACIRKKMASVAGPPLFLRYETSPADVQGAQEKGTAAGEGAGPVSTPVKGTREITATVLPGGRMAPVVHAGPVRNDLCRTLRRD